MNPSSLFLKPTVLIFLTFLISACGTGADVESCLSEGECEAVLEVASFNTEIPIDPDDPFWTAPDGPQKIKVELGPQMITNPKWPNPSIKEVTVQAARSGTDMSILLEWQDPSLDNTFEVSATHTDQAAVMFPINHGPTPPPITMGAEAERVNIWQWKAALEKSLPGRRGGTRIGDNPPSSTVEGRSPVDDLSAEGFSTLTAQGHQDVLGKGVWVNKTWRVVFRRSLTNSHESDVQFKHSVQMAVAVWNGQNRERNGQKGITGWILLHFI